MLNITKSGKQLIDDDGTYPDPGKLKNAKVNDTKGTFVFYLFADCLFRPRSERGVNRSTW